MTGCPHGESELRGAQGGCPEERQCALVVEPFLGERGEFLRLADRLTAPRKERLRRFVELNYSSATLCRILSLSA
jgi:hypothetical protein